MPVRHDNRDDRDVGDPACLVSVVAIPPTVLAAWAVATVIRVETCDEEEAPTRLVMSAISLLSVTAGWSARSAWRLDLCQRLRRRLASLRCPYQWRGALAAIRLRPFDASSLLMTWQRRDAAEQIERLDKGSDQRQALHEVVRLCFHIMYAVCILTI